MTIALKKSNRRAAFTRIELIVVVVILSVLAILLIPAFSRANSKAERVSCVYNLKQIGTAYRLWANDHGNQYPSEAAATNNGWSGLLTRANAATYCWTNYVVMSNELGLGTRVLTCPTDERQPAADFAQITNDLALSYFVGTEASDMYPQAILGGDRNLGPGTIPQDDYGYSPANGQGNDVTINGPTCWSRKMHQDAGNILLGDGSSQQATSAGFRQNWLKPVLEASATNHVPVRLIFP